LLCEMHTSRVYAHEIRVREMHAYEVHARETHAHEVRTHEVYANETHAYEMPREVQLVRYTPVRCTPTSR
jgi:hypothetical protein